MICPNCQKKLKCVDSRPTGDNTRVRLYKCHNCGYSESSDEKMTDTYRSKKQTAIIII